MTIIQKTVQEIGGGTRVYGLTVSHELRAVNRGMRPEKQERKWRKA